MTMRAPHRSILSVAIATACGLAPNAAMAEPAPASDDGTQSELPVRAVWAGARLGIFAPSGGLYANRNLVTTSFRDVVSDGPSVEVDAGVRLARYFVIYGFWDYASLGPGSSASWTDAR